MSQDPTVLEFRHSPTATSKTLRLQWGQDPAVLEFWPRRICHVWHAWLQWGQVAAVLEFDEAVRTIPRQDRFNGARSLRSWNFRPAAGGTGTWAGFNGARSLRSWN